MRNNKGQFEKGNSLGGRKLNSKNKITQDIRDTFLHFINDNLETLQSNFEQLDPEKKFKVLFDLSKFVIPTVKTINFSDVVGELSEEDFNKVVERIKAEYSQN